MIITQGIYNFEDVRRLAESEIPVVSVEQTFNGRTAIISDNVGSMEEIVRYLYSLGHRRLAFIHGEIGDVTRARLAGFHRGGFYTGYPETPGREKNAGLYPLPGRYFLHSRDRRRPGHGAVCAWGRQLLRF